jgi:hypothetical protein
MVEVQLLGFFKQRQEGAGEPAVVAIALEAGDALTLTGEVVGAAAHTRLDRRQLAGALGLVHGAW